MLTPTISPLAASEMTKPVHLIFIGVLVLAVAVWALVSWLRRDRDQDGR
ncbi:hypothetical protein OG900_37475 [Streptomyces sp. NBC_00433]